MGIRLVSIAVLTCCLGADGLANVQTRPAPALRSDRVRSERVRYLTDRSRTEKEAAWALARRQGWSPRVERGGVISELMFIRDGRVYVCRTANQSASVSAAVDLIRGVLPYSLSGSGQTAGVWDSARARSSHQELAGRAFAIDGTTWSDHATHVSGTIGAAGVVASAMGMAPAVRVDSYDWTNDLGEITARAMAVPGEPDKIQVSNHSYVYAAGWDSSSGMSRWYGTWGNLESEHFGEYNGLTSDWDDLCFDAPCYLPVKAAGNDRDDLSPAPGATFEYRDNGVWQQKTYDPASDPYADNWDAGGYDTITTVGTAKNLLTVGAVFDAVYGGQRDVSLASMTAFSGWGPTDDGRVKPDIVASGMGVYSCTAVSETTYSSYNGTSMATAVVSGAAVLLVEYHSTLFPGQYMRSCMLKGLILHTADDLGTPGPDYQHGWGLLNAQAAAEQLRLHRRMPGTNRLAEGSLTSAQPGYSQAYYWNGTDQIKVTLCWTDPPATALAGLDNPSPRLINDLDLRVLAPDGTTLHMPYVLDPLAPTSAAVGGDNTRDNVEQVEIPSPTAGSYTVNVSHKGSLVNGEQFFALIVSGVTGLVRGDYDHDEDVDGLDLQAWESCASGPGIAVTSGCEDKDLDNDGDVDQADFGVLQHCYSGAGGVPAADCFE